MQELLAHTLGPQIKIVFKDNGVRSAALSGRMSNVFTSSARETSSSSARVLLPAASTEKVPEVRRTGSHFEIDLSAATLGLDPSKPDSVRSLPFTVAFSDTDDAGARQETVIATSPVRWNKRQTFGDLTRLPSACRRFPPFGEPM